MNSLYARIRTRARQLVSMYPPALFYTDFPEANQESRKIYLSHPIIRQLRRDISDQLTHNLGHGMKHAEKVTLDAGTLMLIEGQRHGYAADALHRNTVSAQIAGLLHDIKRTHRNHAEIGAMYARQILKSYPLTPPEIDDICQAIQNHEAFTKGAPITTSEAQLLANCLYDADKFRWGPDNFSDTIWDMVEFSGTPLNDFMTFYPKGMSLLKKIRSTFRTPTGQKYGPEFIDIGLEIGHLLHEIICTEFRDYF